jgi:ATP-dependent Lon protease
MSNDPSDTGFDPPLVDEDITSTGAAADSSEDEERLKHLPRILRYAMLVEKAAPFVPQRLAAEIEEACPELPLNAAWMKAQDAGLSIALATELDHRAVADDRSDLRSLADCVRLIGLVVPRDNADLDDHRRVAKALLHAMRSLPSKTDITLLAGIEAFCFGWAALPACTNLLPRNMRSSAAANAIFLGGRTAVHRIAAAEEAVWNSMNRTKQSLSETHPTETAEAEQNTNSVSAAVAGGDNSPVSQAQVLVCTIPEEQLKNGKMAEVLRPLKRAINTALPLVAVPLLHEVRNLLLFEFPYAEAVIDFALADLIGRTTVKLLPLLLVGDPGGGKSRFARRLAELLGIHCWRTDASRSDGAVFGGTDKRWYSAEPCHPFLAIARAGHANPAVLLDEIEKAGTRADYGRLWDCALGFLEPETNARYPDPALQVNLDLSHVSYIATANSLDPLPSPLRDRFRVVQFPKPGADDLDALLPAVVADIARERGLDRRWTPPLDVVERDAASVHWRGGSVRRLRRVVEAILRERDLHAARN